MEYHRIHKLQTGIISPTKLRMKLMGSLNLKNKDGSNTNSSRTSPARLEDSQFVNNSLLASTIPDFDNEVGQSLPATTCSQTVSKENGDGGHAMKLQSSRADGGNSSAAVHPMKFMEDENLDYDSNASSSSFEFHKGERRVRSMTSSFSRPTSYKWNDAEKWIVNKQIPQHCPSKSHKLQPQGNRTASEPNGHDCRRRVEFCQPVEKFSFPQTKDLNEIIPSKNVTDDTSDAPGIRAVTMRDMGTEMTPVPSQEPSRSVTPVGATTPTSSLPSTPRQGGTISSQQHDSKSHSRIEDGIRELSEEEIKLKTRREIVELGVQLGKMNIAAWASKDEQEKCASHEMADTLDLQRVEYEKRAAAWVEAEKSRQDARYRREEVKIEAWESQQKLKLEAEMRKIEARIEETRIHAQAKMMKKIAMARKQSDEKRSAAEARKNRQAERTAAGAECIRQTGRPPSDYLCCGLL